MVLHVFISNQHCQSIVKFAKETANVYNHNTSYQQMCGNITPEGFNKIEMIRQDTHVHINDYSMFYRMCMKIHAFRMQHNNNIIIVHTNDFVHVCTLSIV